MHVIIEMSGVGNWEPLPGEGLGGPQHIPTHIRPTALQPTREIADHEALRLAREHPDRKFVVFSPVAAGITVKVPSHTTLGGKVIGERGIATLVQIQEEEADDGIPF